MKQNSPDWRLFIFWIEVKIQTIQIVLEKDILFTWIHDGSSNWKPQKLTL